MDCELDLMGRFLTERLVAANYSFCPPVSATFPIEAGDPTHYARRRSSESTMITSLTITREHARRFHLQATGLAMPFRDVPAALRHHGFIQMDPINICGRMHDLILRNRVAGYREGDLLAFTYSVKNPDERRALEHYLPGQGILVTFPIEAWPQLVPHMKRRSQRREGSHGKLSVAEERVARKILGELSRRGPLTSTDIEHEGRAMSAWGTPGRLVKLVMEKLFTHGRVLITERRLFRRVYDLPERVLPAAWLAAPTPAPRDHERWLIQQRLTQRRLVTLKRAEVPLVEDLICRVGVEGCPPLYCLNEDRALLDCAEENSRTASDLRLLAPLDPLIYDRKVTATLWDFDYTWEVYTPAAKRTRGYYALPVLADNAIVGHVDPKVDRKAGRLSVIGRRVKRGHKASPAVKALAEFLGLRR